MISTRREESLSDSFETIDGGEKGDDDPTPSMKAELTQWRIFSGSFRLIASVVRGYEQVVFNLVEISV